MTTINEARKNIKKMGYSVKSIKYNALGAIKFVVSKGNYELNNGIITKEILAENQKIYDYLTELRTEKMKKDGYIILW